MQERLTIARPYAEAAFAIAREEDRIDDWAQQLALLAAIVRDERMSAIIKDPRVPEARLLELLVAVSEDRLDAGVRRFVKVLIDADRLAVAPEIATVFERARAEAKGIAEVELVTAYEVSEEQEKRIEEAIRSRLGKPVDMSKRVDAALIGGAVIRVGDSVIDASVRGRLQELAGSLA